MFTDVVLVEEHVELLGADPQVRLVELVGDVPSQGSELPPLLHESVEEAEAEQEFAELGSLLVASEELVVTDRVSQV